MRLVKLTPIRGSGDLYVNPSGLSAVLRNNDGVTLVCFARREYTVRETPAEVAALVERAMEGEGVLLTAEVCEPGAGAESPIPLEVGQVWASPDGDTAAIKMFGFDDTVYFDPSKRRRGGRDWFSQAQFRREYPDLLRPAPEPEAPGSEVLEAFQVWGDDRGNCVMVEDARADSIHYRKLRKDATGGMAADSPADFRRKYPNFIEPAPEPEAASPGPADDDVIERLARRDPECSPEYRRYDGWDY